MLVTLSAGNYKKFQCHNWEGGGHIFQNYFLRILLPPSLLHFSWQCHHGHLYIIIMKLMRGEQPREKTVFIYLFSEEV